MRRYKLPAPAIPAGTVEVWEVPGPDGFCAIEFHWHDARWGAAFSGRYSHLATAHAFYTFRFLRGDTEAAWSVPDVGFGAVGTANAKEVRRWLAAHPEWSTPPCSQAYELLRSYWATYWAAPIDVRETFLPWLRTRTQPLMST